MRLSVLALFATVVGLGCKHQPPGKCQPLPDKSVIACVNDEPVSKVEVAGRMRNAEWIPGSSKKLDPARRALDEAMRAQLLASEAKRRKLKLSLDAPPSSASWVLALREDEARSRNLSRSSVSDDEARRYYDEHPEAFGHVDEAKMQAIIVSDPLVAERVYEAARSADEARFAELARQHSEDVASRDKGGDIGVVRAARGADREILRLALGLRRAGAIGGPVQAADGRWYVVRVVSAPVERLPPWSERSREKARDILLDERLDAAMKELSDRLMTGAALRVFDDAVAELSPRGRDR